MTSHTYQATTIEALREQFKSSTQAAENHAASARKFLADALGFAAAARDAAQLLAVADPDWRAECETPMVTRLLRLQAWREMLDFVEAHPEISIGDYASITIEQPDGEPATAEFIESIEHLGIEVTHRRSATHGDTVAAELWFGGREVKLTAWAKVEPAPEPEPAAIKEHQALEADGSPLDPAAVDKLLRRGIVESAAALAEAPADVDPLAETAAHPARPRPSREEAPIQVGDRVLIRRDEQTEAQGLKPFPAELEGCTGTVTEVDAHAYIENPDRGDLDDPPIVVQVDGVTATHCFAVAELELTIRIEDAEAGHAADRLTGQPA